MSIARRSLQVVALISTLVVGAASMAVIVTQTTWFKEWLRGFIVRQADDYVNGRLSIGRLDGNLFFGIELGDVEIAANGETVVDIDDVGLDYNAFTFITGNVVLDDIRLTRPVFRLERTADGWNLAQLIKARTPETPDRRRPLEIGEIGISDGTLYIEDGSVGTSGVDAPSRVERLDASLGVKSDENELTVNVNHVSLRTAEPSFGVNALSGVIRRTKDELVFDNVAIRTEETSLRVNGTVRNLESDAPIVDLQASSDKLSLPELAGIVPGLRGYELQPAFEVTASGPVDRLAINLAAREATLGKVEGDLIVDATAPERRVSGSASAEHLNLVAFSRTRNEALQSDITGDATFDLRLPGEGRVLSGTYAGNLDHVRVAGYEARNVVGNGRIDGPVVRVNARADAYGGHATAAGTVRTDAPLALDLRGRATNVDLRNLPVTLNVPRASSALQFTYSLSGRDRTFSGDATFDRSTLAGATIGAGTVGTFRFGGGVPEYSAKGEIVDADVQRIGREFEIRAIATDKYRSRVNGSFDVKGSGGGRYPLALDVTGTLVESELFGAMFPRMDVTTRLAGGDATIATAGSFSGLDPAVPTGNERLAGSLTGDIDAETTLRGYATGVTPESIDVAGQVNLENSRVGRIAIDTAVVDGRYANREGQLNQATVTGADVNLDAKGTIALNDTGTSNLAVHAESVALDRFGELIGQPLKGAAIVDATVTGNARELKADGTLKGSNVGHGENEALSLNSTFSAAIPNLTAADARVQAKSVATFLEVRGQRINELTAETTYEKSRLTFDAVATQEQRELAAAGELVLHPDHQEVHLGNVALRSEQVEWRSEPGSSAAIRYGGGRIEVDSLRLVNGDQRIQASGVVGSATEPLRVRAENVDVAQLDALLLGDQRLAGRFTADATVRGTTDAPQVAATFTLSAGAFQGFMFESLTGTVDYAQRDVTLDVRLQQTPTAWLTAKGRTPLTLFRANPPDIGDAHGQGGPVDIQIASSDIDLGVVQGFTSYVTDVTGTMRANVHLTGTGYDPHLDGSVDIRGGAFTVPDLGTNYTGLDTRIELKPDVVTIQEFKILDNRGFPMTVGGTLAVHERAVGEVNVEVTSENFEVVDNQFADLKLDTDIRLTGELRKPRVEGFVEVENGTIFVARLLEAVTADPYATQATELEPGEARSGLFDAVDLEVALAIPSNLVLRGNDLRPANAPIEIGDVNVTVGGAIQVRKSPGAEVRVVGEVNTIRGNYNFQGRRFEIMRDGRIRFAGTEEIDPTLDIRARRLISGVETVVRVQGTMKQPELSFSSNPPLDQADILSLIVFNQPLNELGEGQQVSLADRAAALAGGYLASGLTRALGSALELDEFEIQASGDDGAGPSLTVGEQVGEHFFFRVRQGFGDAQATELILEYQLKDFLRIQGTAAEVAGGTQRLTFRRVERAGLDLIFFFSY